MHEFVANACMKIFCVIKLQRHHKHQLFVSQQIQLLEMRLPPFLNTNLLQLVNEGITSF
ncbi:hypothetical protein I3842_15G111600 [Carya illinoinensis]|uniref:Uncharacterized protein n=1 Tax=Carya illinoinensis TaxID=32201 RepID=A0A922D7I7_CARIL|nr:hypothetical protein I3842_15G111600 [Carya illinoinensis]